MLFDCVCIWGWPLHSHTHSYIHNGFFRAAQQLGIPTVWLDNEAGAGDNLPPNTLFLTETQVDSHIPLRSDCFYVTHNCDAQKYAGLKVVAMQCLTNASSGEQFLGKPWLLRDNTTLCMPWATDLLPHEVQDNMDRLEDIFANRGPEAQFVGYFIPDPWHEADRILQQKSIKLVKCGGYGLQNVSVQENMRRIQSGRIAPALQSKEQIERGYLPCRILKNISYGSLGITNNPAVERLFGSELFQGLVFGETIEETLDKALRAEMDFAMQRKLMEHIKLNHTFVNRLQELEEVFKIAGFMKQVPQPPATRLKVVHLTFHRGCELDLQGVADELGWQLRSIMLLRELGATNTWYTMTDDVVDLLWNRFGSILEDADVVITSDTAPLARLFVKHPVKHLIVWVCNRINYSCTVPYYAQEVRQLSHQPWVQYVAYTPFEVQYAKDLGFEVKWHGTVRPLGRVSSPASFPRPSTVFVGKYHNDCISVDLRSLIQPFVEQVRFSIGNLTEYNGSSDLQTYAAVIHIPYAASNLALFEALANKIPYLLPSQTFLQSMIDRKVSFPMRENLFVPHSNASAIEWYRYADCFLTFDSFDQIPSLLTRQSLDACKERLGKRYSLHKQIVLAQWKWLTGAQDIFATFKPYLANAIFPYFPKEKFLHWFHRLPLQRDVTFAEVIRVLKSKGRPLRILELGTSRSFVDGMFPGCNSNDTTFWEPHVMDRWDWSAGMFTKVMASAFPNASITTVDIAREHLNRCQLMVQGSNIHFVCSKSEDFLGHTSEKFDLVYMDTGDMTPIAQTSELHFREAQLVKRVLMPDGLLLIDDVRSCVPLEAGERNVLGKAFKSIPYLVDHGFYVSMDEYQVLLRQKH